MEFDLETKLSVKSFVQIKINNTFEDINLHKLHLQTLASQDDIIVIKTSTTNHLFTIYILSAFSIICIVLIMMFTRRSTTIITPVELPLNYVPAIPSMWPSLHSRRGGLTYTALQSICDSVPPAKPPRHSSLLTWAMECITMLQVPTQHFDRTSIATVLINRNENCRTSVFLGTCLDTDTKSCIHF